MYKKTSYICFKVVAAITLFLLFGGSSFASNSVLSSGKWYKMAVSSTGMYVINSADLKAMGVDVGSINPKNIRLFHNGGGMLPVINMAKMTAGSMMATIFCFMHVDRWCGNTSWQRTITAI